MLTDQPAAARQILSKVLEDKIVLRPTTMGDGAAAYEVEANFTLRGLFAGLVSDSRTVELCPGRMALGGVSQFLSQFANFHFANDAKCMILKTERWPRSMAHAWKANRLSNAKQR